MRRMYLVFYLLLLLVTVGIFPAAAQETDSPLVVFVLNPDINSASPFDSGPNGLTNLNAIFQQQGAQTQVVNLVQFVPDEADVVVLVGPRQKLSIIALTRLWVHLSRGKHLLLALDPSGYGDTSTETNNSGLVTFLDNAYGLLPYDAFMAETWFTKDSIVTLSSTFMQTHSDVVQHPVVAPLFSYEIPVEVWGARPIRVEPIGVYSRAVPLLQTSSAYGETNADVLLFDSDDPPLERNIEVDITGRVDVAGLAENSRTGSRVALLGDSEMLRNGYGLAALPENQQPRYLGNYLFAERLAAWLLGVPEDSWTDLPPNYTRIALDGNATDWDRDLSPTLDSVDSAPQDYNLRGIRAFHDDTYVYVLAQMVNTPSPDIGFSINFTANEQPVTISATVGSATLKVGEAEPVNISDVTMVAGNAVEIRLPLRVMGDSNRIDRFCAYQTVDGQPVETDCLSSRIQIVAKDSEAPSDLLGTEAPLVTVIGVRNVILRSEPSTSASEVLRMDGGRILRAVGRSATGDWIQVETGAFGGWVFASLVGANFDIINLPITEVQPQP